MLAEMASAHTVDFIILDVTAIPLLFLSRRILRRRCVILLAFFQLGSTRACARTVQTLRSLWALGPCYKAQLLIISFIDLSY